MTEGDVAGALVDQLEAEARFVDAGSFTLDPRKAREKLAAHQLADPERFVLLLVEAAHLLQNCTNLAFTIHPGITRAHFEGVELRGDELRGCFDAMFVDVTGFDPQQARRLRGRQRLALALNTALDLPKARVEMRSMIAGEETCVLVEIDAEGNMQTRELPSTATSAFVVEIWHAARADDQCTALCQDARYAKLPVHLNGTRIEDGSADLLDSVDVCVVSPLVIGRVGWCGAVAHEKEGMIALVANGVVVEAYSEPRMPVGALALLDADTLERDLSQSKFRRDEIFHGRVAAVLPACESLSQPAPNLGPQTLGIDELIGGIFSIFGGVLAVGAAIGLWVEFGVVVIGVVIVGIGIWSCWQGFDYVRRVRRRWRLQAHGRAGIGTIEFSDRPRGDQSNAVRVDLQIERPGQEGYRTWLQTPVDSRSEHLIERGKRVYLRIDPNISGPDPTDREHVAFYSPSRR